MELRAIKQGLAEKWVRTRQKILLALRIRKLSCREHIDFGRQEERDEIREWAEKNHNTEVLNYINNKEPIRDYSKWR